MSRIDVQTDVWMHKDAFTFDYICLIMYSISIKLGSCLSGLELITELNGNPHWLMMLKYPRLIDSHCHCRVVNSTFYQSDKILLMTATMLSDKIRSSIGTPVSRTYRVLGHRFQPLDIKCFYRGLIRNVFGEGDRCCQLYLSLAALGTDRFMLCKFLVCFIF